MNTQKEAALPPPDCSAWLGDLGGSAVDQDGNVIRRNMAVVFQGVIWNVDNIGKYWVSLHRMMDDGRKEFGLVGFRNWRLLSVLGWYLGALPNTPEGRGSDAK